MDILFLKGKHYLSKLIQKNCSLDSVSLWKKIWSGMCNKNVYVSSSLYSILYRHRAKAGCVIVSPEPVAFTKAASASSGHQASAPLICCCFSVCVVVVVSDQKKIYYLHFIGQVCTNCLIYYDPKHLHLFNNIHLPKCYWQRDSS